VNDWGLNDPARALTSWPNFSTLALIDQYHTPMPCGSW